MRPNLQLTSLLQVVYAYDANEHTHSESEVPWYQPLCGSFWSISGFRQTHLGRVCTHGLVCTMEMLRIAPKGSAQVGDGSMPWWSFFVRSRVRGFNYFALRYLQILIPKFP